MNRIQRGFTLIELIIVVAIIGILVSIALPSYQGYIAKSTHASAYFEISGGRVLTDIYLLDSISVNTPAEISLTSSTSHCSTITAIADAILNTARIACTIQGNSLVNNKTIRLDRGADGAWICESTVDVEYIGKQCVHI